MRETLCRHLCCPGCRADLTLQTGERDGAEILTGTLRCSGCEREYPIARGVPRFVPEELPAPLQHTAANFGASWKIWNRIDDQRYRWQLLNWLQPLQPKDFAGKTVLDGGCGKGRHLRLVAEFGADEVIGIDLSAAVDVAYDNTRGLDNVHIVQGDLFQMPFKGGFDLAYSIGVLHHTPDPGRAFEATCGQVRPGGTVACWVYGRENNGWIVTLVNPVRRRVTRYLPSWMVRAAAWVLAGILFAVIYAVYLPAQALSLQPFYAEYMHNLRKLGFAETRHIVYDHLIAPMAFYLPREEVERWFDRTGIRDPMISWVNRNSWSGIGSIPVRSEAA